MHARFHGCVLGVRFYEAAVPRGHDRFLANVALQKQIRVWQQGIDNVEPAERHHRFVEVRLQLAIHIGRGKRLERHNYKAWQEMPFATPQKRMPVTPRSER